MNHLHHARGLKLCNLWVLWLSVTIGDLLTLYGGLDQHGWVYIPHTLFDLFTPILLGNLGSPARKFTLPLLFTVLWLANRVGRQLSSSALRILYNLIVLLFLTASVDYLSWGGWVSGARVAQMFRVGHPLAR